MLIVSWEHNHSQIIVANVLLFLALSAAEQRRGWVGNRVLVAFEQEIVFWPDYSDNSDTANNRTQGSHSL